MMPYRICKTLEIETSHLLSKHPGNCKFPHGHSRKIELVLESETLNANEMIVDYKILKEIISDLLGQLDHAMCVNTNDPNYAELKKMYGDRIVDIEDKDPTTEVLVKIIFDLLNERIGDYSQNPDADYPPAKTIRVSRVRLWETSSSWAEYEA